MHNWHEIVRGRLAGTGADPVADAGLIQELAQHLEDRFAESLGRGATGDQALADALRELDHHERLVPELAKNRPAPIAPPPVGGPPLHSHLAALWQDIRYAARTLRRSPAFTFAAVVTVALSTAPTIAALSVGNWLFLRPVPEVSRPEQLATVTFGVPSERGGLTVVRPSYDHIANLGTVSPSVKGMAGWQPGEVSIASGNGEARMVQGEFVSGNYFDVLGIRMSAGRSFQPEEDRPPEGTLVAVLSYRLARSLFNDRSPIGAHIQVNRNPVTVIGVAPRNYSGSYAIARTDIWLPGQATPVIQHIPAPNRRADRGPFYQYVIRRAPDASFERAGAELQNAVLALSKNDPGALTLEKVTPRLAPGFAAPGAAFGSTIAALLGLGALLVLMAAANLANMFGFRCVRRAHETALRRALGASAGRLLQVNMAESIAVAAMGCLAGMVMVFIAQKMVGGIIVGGAVEIPEIPLDWRLLWMTMGLALGVGIVMGVAPARLSTRKNLAMIIGSSGRFAGRTATRMRTGLAVVQMALSLTLLVGALLFVGTLRNLRALDPGFEPKGLTQYELEFRTQGYSPERISLFYQDLLARLSGTPGIAAVAVARGVPMFGGEIGMGRNFLPGIAGGEGHRITYSQVSSGYFDALGIALISGRGFTPEETLRRPEPEASVIISESLARRLYGTNLAVGRPLTITATLGEPEHEVRIIGVAEDVRWDDLSEMPPFMLYRAITRFSGGEELLVRSSDRPDRVIPTVRDAVKALDPALPMQALLMDEVVSLKLGQQRTFAWVLGLLATIGFLLAGIGIHGLVSQSVVERTREFGIRLAVGAGRREIIRLVLRSALVVVAAGAPLGMALAAMLGRVLRNRLFGVTPVEPAAYIAAIAVLLAVVVAASLAPAWSASRANPSDVLRAE